MAIPLGGSGGDENPKLCSDHTGRTTAQGIADHGDRAVIAVQYTGPKEAKCDKCGVLTRSSTTTVGARTIGCYSGISSDEARHPTRVTLCFAWTAPPALVTAECSAPPPPGRWAVDGSRPSP